VIGSKNIFGNNIQVGDETTFKVYCEVRDGTKIGKRGSFGSRCTIAKNNIIEDDVTIKFHLVTTAIPKLGDRIETHPCTVRKKAKCGANVTLMPGVTVGENAEIGACSQVRHDVPPNEVWYGNPAKFFRKVNE